MPVKSGALPRSGSFTVFLAVGAPPVATTVDCELPAPVQLKLWPSSCSIFLTNWLTFSWSKPRSWLHTVLSTEFSMDEV